MGFKVRVYSIKDGEVVDEVHEAPSEHMFIDQLLTSGLDYELKWTPHEAEPAQLIVY